MKIIILLKLYYLQKYTDMKNVIEATFFLKLDFIKAFFIQIQITGLELQIQIPYLSFQFHKKKRYRLLGYDVMHG